MDDESLDDIIKKVERNKRRFEKAQPTLLKVIKGANPEIDSLEVTTQRHNYTMPHPGYIVEIPVLKITIKSGIDKMTASFVGRIVVKQIKDLIGVNIQEYGAGLDVELYLIEVKKIW